MPVTPPTDQTVKSQIVLITAALALVGFFLEIGPVCGAFPLVIIGLSLELPTFGFFAYLALAASAAAGLHLGEKEPTPKEPPKEAPTPQSAGEIEHVGERVRVRPELHQLRMIFTALGGYAILKWLNITLMRPAAEARGIEVSQLLRAFEFGFIFMALGWFIMWQLLRWYAQRRKWIRLQDELVGGDVTRIIAVLLLIKPLIYFVNLTLRLPTEGALLTATAALLHLAIVPAAVLLWYVRPLTLRRTVTGLLITGAAIVALTLLRALVERSLVG